MLDINSEPIWQAEEYHIHSKAQYTSALQLLQKIKLSGDEKILDIGCGDGKISAILAQKLYSGSVLGIDISQEMVNFARSAFLIEQFNNLSFSLQDAQKLDYSNEFDIVFSSYAVQWIRNKDAFLKSVKRSLIASGYMVFTIPLGISYALEESIRIITTQKTWIQYFQAFTPNWFFPSEYEFYHLLINNNLQPLHLQTVSQEEIFSSREDFETYVIQWFFYLQPLPENLKRVFFDRIIDKYLELEPVLPNGEVSFSFQHLDIIAS